MGSACSLQAGSRSVPGGWSAHAPHSDHSLILSGKVTAVHAGYSLTGKYKLRRWHPAPFTSLAPSLF